ncbi:MAG: DUF3160 domain-containing protein [Candidatus Buchananbacteria bacterium]
MGENRLIYVIAIIIIAIIIVASALGLFFYWYRPSQEVTPLPPTNTESPTTAQPGFLPTTAETTSTNPASLAAENLEKEKRFISSYWQAPTSTYQAKTTSYTLPLNKIKEQVANYRDLSRKINIESALPLLSKNGFAVIANPFKPTTSDWETAYDNIHKSKLPIIITADSLAGIYQTTLNVVYRETEQNIFYSSLWNLVKEMHDKVQRRYYARYRQMGIESDTLTEANRLELAYLSVALKLLQPEPNQVKEALAGDDQFFSPLEAETYAVKISTDLTEEVSAEVKLIDEKSKSARSPIFSYQKSYEAYVIPAYYQGSEKLKNYYLAATWLNDILFPLWSKSDSCPNCLLDQQDHEINFAAALLLSNDLASDQNLKNRWANIYKTVGFFRGIETNSTYLYYDQALQDLYGKNYDLDKIFSVNADDNKKTIAAIQNKINSYQFPSALSGNPLTKENKGLRLLRSRYLPEEQLFEKLSQENAGKYLAANPSLKILPFTTCQNQNLGRCFPTALDLFNFLGNSVAKNALNTSQNSSYENYQKNLDIFAADFKNFDDHAWHDNAYLSLLYSVKTLNAKKGTGFPAFMQTAAWQNKSLNTQLGFWTNFHQEIDLEKGRITTEANVYTHFPYGYIELQPEFYSELKSNVEMIMNGFSSLQIIPPVSKSYERLNNLKILLDNAVRLSKKEMEKTSSFDKKDYEFINKFSSQIRLILGDIKKENVQNKFSFGITKKTRGNVKEYIDGINYVVVVYPEASKKLIFALGPVYNYVEGKDDLRPTWAWQNEFLVK